MYVRSDFANWLLPNPSLGYCVSLSLHLGSFSGSCHWRAVSAILPCRFEPCARSFFKKNRLYILLHTSHIHTLSLTHSPSHSLTLTYLLIYTHCISLLSLILQALLCVIVPVTRPSSPVANLAYVFFSFPHAPSVFVHKYTHNARMYAYILKHKPL